jgi:hypothetical protein
MSAPPTSVCAQVRAVNEINTLIARIWFEKGHQNFELQHLVLKTQTVALNRKSVRRTQGGYTEK